MIKWLIIILTLLILLTPIVIATANFGDLNFGACDYGKNTPPSIQSFQPSDESPEFTSPINITFNITGDDCEDDATLEWFLQDVQNDTDVNLSVLFTSIGTFNLTGNLSDSFDKATQSWLIGINITITGNISDVLIVPTITSDGNMMVVIANITALDNNLTDVFANLNIIGEFIFLPSTPQNQSVGDVYTINVTQVSWFIGTPLEKKRQSLNVTYIDSTNTSFQGVSEKLKIKGDQEMSIAVAIIVIFVISVYFFILAKLFTERQFTEHGLIKLMFFMIAFWILLLPLNVAVQFNDDQGGPAAVTDNVNTLYRVMIYLNFFITVYFLLWFVVQMLKKIGVAKRE